MIILNLKGGLGNQMFQYAAARALSLQNNDELKLEVNGLERANAVGDIYRAFTLQGFNIEKHIATTLEVQTLKYPYGIISKGMRYVRQRVLRQHNILWNPAFFDQHGNLFLDGYWQSPRYFADIRDVLLDDFSLESTLSAFGNSFAQQIDGSAAVSLHVRRGDYVANPSVLKEFGICTLEYYEKSISLIKKETTNPVFFVFSDDIDWVRTHLNIGENAVFVSHPSLTEAQEVHLMSRCKHNIIANSTFSWWGAWLNQNPDKIVLAPTPWYNNKPYDTALIPDTWTQLPK